MSIVISVNPQEVRDRAGDIVKYADNYKDAYEELYKKAKALDQQWQGKDNRAYYEQIEGFRDDLGNMFELMKAYAKHLQDAADTYETTQTAIEQNARKLQN